MKIVIADLYAIPSYGGKQVIEQKILKRKGMKVTDSYVEEINQSTETNNLIMVVDEKATEKHRKLMAEKQDKIDEAVELKRAADANLVGKAIGNILNTEKPGRKKAGKQSETENETENETIE